MLSFLEIIWPRQERGFSTNKYLQKHKPGLKDCHAAWCSDSHKMILGSFKAAIPTPGAKSLLKEELSSGSHQGSPIYTAHYTHCSELPLMDAGLLLAQSSNKAAQKWKKQCMNHQGHVHCPRMAHSWNQGSVQHCSDCKRELSSAEGRQSTPSTQKTSPELLQGNLTSGENERTIPCLSLICRTNIYRIYSHKCHVTTIILNTALQSSSMYHFRRDLLSSQRFLQDQHFAF